MFYWRICPQLTAGSWVSYWAGVFLWLFAVELSWGYGAELAARIGDELFHDLDAPVRRVAAMDTFVAYQPVLEDAILPQPEDLYRAMAEIAAF